MRAATPKADPDLRVAAALPERAARQGPEPFHGFPAPELAGIPPLRPGLADGAFPPTPANDTLPRRPQPFPPLLLGALVMLLDIAVILGAGAGADLFTGGHGGALRNVTLFVVALTIGGGVAIGAYEHSILFSGRRQFRRIGAAALAAVCIMLAAAWAFGALPRVHPAWLAIACALGGAGLAVARGGAATLLRATPRGARRTVVLGAGRQAARLLTALQGDPAGLAVVGVVEQRGARAGRLPEGVPRLGGMAQLIGMIRRGEVEVVAIAMPWAAEARVEALVEQLSALPVEIRLAPDLLAARLQRNGRPPLPPLLCARPISGLDALLKSISDYLLAGIALLVAALPMLLIAIAVKLDSPGPVLFRQRRTGFNDRPFDVLKFRTMYADAADPEAVRQVLEGDPRVTRIGRFLRRTSLDELPQILNVLRGEMSFVGPRPHAPGTRAGNRRFEEVVANYAARHRVKPGLTGLAQVRGYRGPTPTEEQIMRRVESDLEYIARWSLWLDFVIILRTLAVVVRMQNAL